MALAASDFICLFGDTLLPLADDCMYPLAPVVISGSLLQMLGVRFEHLSQGIFKYFLIVFHGRERIIKMMQHCTPFLIFV